VSPAGGYQATTPRSSSNCCEKKSRMMNAKRYAATISAARNSGRGLRRNSAASGGVAGFFFVARSFLMCHSEPRRGEWEKATRCCSHCSCEPPILGRAGSPPARRTPPACADACGSSLRNRTYFLGKRSRTFAAIWRSVILSTVSTPTMRSPSPLLSRRFLSSPLASPGPNI